MAPKSRFVGVRLEPDQQRKLILLSVQAGEPGNMSAGLRWALEQVRVSGSIAAADAAGVGKTYDYTIGGVTFSTNRPLPDAVQKYIHEAARTRAAIAQAEAAKERNVQLKRIADMFANYFEIMVDGAITNERE